MSEGTQTWTVGDTTLTAIVEAQTDGIPAPLLLPDATVDQVRSCGWLADGFARPDGTIGMRVQAFLVQMPGFTALVDPCVGNGKRRTFPYWSGGGWPWMERLLATGVTPEEIDLVVHTHLHADHVGWDTHLVDGRWVPTFPGAHHVYVGEELEYWRRGEHRVAEDVYGDSVAPVVEAGLAKVVEADADLGHGLRLVPTPGHTPGHVSLEVGSGGGGFVVTGDLMHHPVQFHEPGLAEIADWDVRLARATRSDFLDGAATAGTLLAGTHFPTHPVGRVVTEAGRWRFVPEAPG